jgi:SAM-dependent methyltransferase
MNTRDKETGEVYGKALAKEYGHMSVAGKLEGNVNRWLQGTLAKLVPDQDVVDAGCGSGRWIPTLEEAGMRHYTGVDASGDILAQIEGVNGGHEVIQWPIAAEILRRAQETRQKLYVQGNLRDVLPALGPKAQIVLNSFNIVCFDDPREPIEAMEACLQRNGRLVCMTNTFVPAELAPDPTSPDIAIPIDLSAFRGKELELQGHKLFRHILHLPNGQDLPLQDHIHPLPNFAAVLDDETWDIEEAQVYAAQGCTLVNPDDPAAATIFENTNFGEAGQDVFRPGNGSDLQYVKLCFVARKK